MKSWLISVLTFLLAAAVLVGCSAEEQANERDARTFSAVNMESFSREDWIAVGDKYLSEAIYNRRSFGSIAHSNQALAAYLRASLIEENK